MKWTLRFLIGNQIHNVRITLRRLPRSRRSEYFEEYFLDIRRFLEKFDFSQVLF